MKGAYFQFILMALINPFFWRGIIESELPCMVSLASWIYDLWASSSSVMYRYVKSLAPILLLI